MDSIVESWDWEVFVGSDREKLTSIDEIAGMYGISARELQDLSGLGAPVFEPPYDLDAILAWVEEPANRSRLRRARFVGPLNDDKATITDIIKALPSIRVSAYLWMLTFMLTIIGTVAGLWALIEPSANSNIEREGPKEALIIGPPPTADIKIAKSIHHYRILHFVDRRTGAAPLSKRFIGYPQEKLGRVVDLYDEAIVSNFYILHPTSAEVFKVDSLSSGMTFIAPVTPTIENLVDSAGNLLPSAHDYRTGAFKAMEMELPLGEAARDGTRPLIAVDFHYINGFQASPQREGGRSIPEYRSDGSVTLNYPTEEANFIFDFSSLDFEAILTDKPIAILRLADGTEKGLKQTWTNGALRVEPLTGLTSGDRVFCDWTWSTESIRY